MIARASSRRTWRGAARGRGADPGGAAGELVKLARLADVVQLGGDDRQGQQPADLAGVVQIRAAPAGSW